MNYGHLWSRKTINAGFGSPSVAAHAKLLLMSLVTGVARPVAAYGKHFLTLIVPVILSAISGMLIKLFFPKRRTNQLARRRDKRLMLSDGIIRCANASHALFAKHYPSPSRTNFMSGSCDYSSTITIYQSILNHYHNFKYTDDIKSLYIALITLAAAFEIRFQPRSILAPNP